MIDAVRLPDTDPRRRLVGVWEQTAGPASADFCHGGYRQTVLVFRLDGNLDVVRYYGDAGQVRMDSRLKYTAKPDGSIVLERDPKASSVDATRDLKVPVGGGQPALTAPAPTARFPLTLQVSTEKDTLTIGPKTYRKRPQSR